MYKEIYEAVGYDQDIPTLETEVKEKLNDMPLSQLQCLRL